MFGLGATLDLFHEAGVEEIERRVLALAGRLAAGLSEKGYEVVGRQASEARSPIISIAVRSGDERERLQRGLQKSNTTCAVRESRVRLSPHFYNTEEEIDRLLSCL